MGFVLFRLQVDRRVRGRHAALLQVCKGERPVVSYSRGKPTRPAQLWHLSCLVSGQEEQLAIGSTVRPQLARQCQVVFRFRIRILSWKQEMLGKLR